MAHVRDFTPGPVEVAATVVAAQHGPQGLYVVPDFS